MESKEQEEMHNPVELAGHLVDLDILDTDDDSIEESSEEEQTW